MRLQELLHRRVELAQRLLVEIVSDVAVVPRDSPGSVRASRAIIAARWRPYGPALGPLGDVACLLRRDRDPRCREDLLGRAPVQGQVRRPELDGIPDRAQSGQVWLGRCDSRSPPASREGSRTAPRPRTSWHPGERSSCRSSSRRTNGTGARLNVAATRGAPRPSAETPRPLISAASPACSGTARSIGRRDQEEQGARVVVEPVERDPRDPPWLAVRPLDQQRGLSVPGWCGHADGDRAARPDRVDERRPAHQAGTNAGHRELDVEQDVVQTRSRPPAFRLALGHTFQRRRTERHGPHPSRVV